MFIETKFPRANRVSLTLLQDKYGFTKAQIEEIKQNWIMDHRNSNIYCKPNSVYHKELEYAKYEERKKQNPQSGTV